MRLPFDPFDGTRAMKAMRLQFNLKKELVARINRRSSIVQRNEKRDIANLMDTWVTWRTEVIFDHGA